MPLNIRSAIILLALISIAAFATIAALTGADISKPFEVFTVASKVVTIDTTLALIFLLWAWKWPMFRWGGWLVPYPNLNGTWTGYIYSDWKNENGDKTPPIPVMMTIKQSFLKLSCVMRTGEMRSDSSCSTFKIDGSEQIKKLIYVYNSQPRPSVRGRSECHEGAMVFEIVEKPEIKLKGQYWTARKTTGEIILDYYGKEILDDFPKDFEDHPVTEPENLR